MHDLSRLLPSTFIRRAVDGCPAHCSWMTTLRILASRSFAGVTEMYQWEEGEDATCWSWREESGSRLPSSHARSGTQWWIGRRPYSSADRGSLRDSTETMTEQCQRSLSPEALTLPLISEGLLPEVDRTVVRRNPDQQPFV